MTTTAQPATTVEQLLEEAWTVDCAIRLRQGTWAADAAERLAARLAGHEEEALRVWSGIDDAIGEALAAETRTVRAAVRALEPALEQGTAWPRPEVHAWVETLIHHEVVAVADAAAQYVD
jgi:hypothetical protein